MTGAGRATVASKGHATRTAVLLAVWLVVAPGGCRPVPVWDRALLAHRCMRPDGRLEEERARTHLFGAREGAQGATGAKGGGCGCK